MKHTRRDVLQKASALGALAVGASGVAAAADCSGVSKWSSSKTYTGGDQAVYDGSLWEAKWWTSGDEPGSSEWGPWEEVGACGDDDGGDDDGGSGVDCSGVSAYDSSATYNGGDQVTYENVLWTAEWWTKGTEPSASANVWTKEGACSDDGEDGDNGGDKNEAPEANFTPDTIAPDVGEEVTFDASESSDPDGSIASYEWDFGDGNSATGEVVTHTYESEENVTVELTVTDDEGATASTTSSIFVGGNTGGDGENRVVAYYRQWAQYGRNYPPADIPFDKVTHVQYAFARPEKDGSVNLVGESHGQQAFWDQNKDWAGTEGGTFADLAKEHEDTSFVLSIGGWGDSEYFSDAALDEESRQQFADDCVKWIKRGNLDGIDIDWEFPGGGGCTEESTGPACDGVANNVRPGDQERFTLLCQAVRDRLDEYAAEIGRDEPFELTAAVSASPEVVEGKADGMNGLEHEKLSDILDFVNVMTFDYRGIWSEYTGHHAPLMSNSNDPAETSGEWNAEFGLNYWESGGWDASQLNMAVPFYGRSWTDVNQPDGEGNGDDDGLFQTYEGEGADASGDGSFPGPNGTGTSLSGVWEAFDLLGSGRGQSNTLNLDGAGWETYWDDDAKCSWSFNTDDRLMLTHPTEKSIREKAQWLSNSPYGGTMLWAIGGDTKDETLITTLWNNLNE